MLADFTIVKENKLLKIKLFRKEKLKQGSCLKNITDIQILVRQEI